MKETEPHLYLPIHLGIIRRLPIPLSYRQRIPHHAIYGAFSMGKTTVVFIQGISVRISSIV